MVGGGEEEGREEDFVFTPHSFAGKPITSPNVWVLIPIHGPTGYFVCVIIARGLRCMLLQLVTENLKVARNFPTTEPSSIGGRLSSNDQKGGPHSFKNMVVPNVLNIYPHQTHHHPGIPSCVAMLRPRHSADVYAGSRYF